jgi:hypothetical protein
LDRQKLNYYLHDDAGQLSSQMGDMYSKTVKANYSNGTCTTMQANCLLKIGD